MRSIPYPIAALAPDGTILAANQAWTQLAQSDNGAPRALGTLGALFPDAATATMEVLRGAPLVTRLGMHLAHGLSGTATWWDLDFLRHVEDPDAVLVTARDATDRVLARRAADDARAEREPIDERLRLAQEAVGIGSWEWNAATGRHAWSTTQFRLYGLDPATDAALSFEEWLAAVDPRDRPAILEHLDVISRNASARDFQIEYRIRRADTGAIRWLLALGRVIETTPNGRVLRILGVNVDITQRRTEHEALRKSEELLRLASDAAGFYAWEWDFATGQISWGAGLEAALGLPPGGFDGTVEAFRALVHPDDARSVETAISRALAGETPGYRATFRMLRRDGGIRWTQTYGTVVRDSAGGLIRVVGMDHDITDQKRIEDGLRSRKDDLRALTDAMPQMIYTATPQGTSDYKNRQWFEYTGQTPEQALGTGWVTALHPDDREATMASWTAAIRSGEPYEREHRLLGKDGNYRWFLSRAVPLRETIDRQIIRWVGTSTDISEIVQARQLAANWAASLETQVAERTRALAEAAVELQAEMRRRQDIQSALLQSQKLEALGQLTAGVAHDFNNLLSVILGSFEKIGRSTADPSLLKTASIGEAATERAILLTRQLLDFGRSEALVPAVVDTETSIRNADRLIDHAINSSIVRSLEIQPGIWPVLTDGHQLEIALLNLAVNARDAMPNGGRLVLAVRNLAPQERPDTLPVRDYICVSVRDTGQGMPPGVVARATQPFFTTKPRGKGTGLGLPMVHAFALRSGGSLRIESREGVGTTVHIILPRAAVTGMERDAMAADEAASSGPHGTRTILLVEDDDQVRQITVAYLRELGYTVIEAPSAEAATVLIHSIAHLDLLVTDVAMPGAAGPDLARRLRAHMPGLPILFMTGHAGREDLAGEQVLLKPFTGSELIRAVVNRIKGGAGEVQGDDTADGGLLRRLRNPALVSAYLFWRAARRGGRPPRLPDLDWSGLPDAEHAFTVAVESAETNMSFRFIKIGRALTARLGRPLEGTSIATLLHADDEVLGSLTDVYHRCVGTFAPSYEYASIGLGDAEPTLFERLVLPVSNDGEHVTHLIGLALFGGAT